jgi:hypothetical protein
MRRSGCWYHIAKQSNSPSAELTTLSLHRRYFDNDDRACGSRAWYLGASHDERGQAVTAKRRFDPERHEENPEWTAQDFARAKPASEVLPAEVIAQFKTATPQPTKKPTSSKPTNKRSPR